MIKNYFAILGYDVCEPSTTLEGDWEDEVKKRWRILTRAVHPDNIANSSDLPFDIDKKKLCKYANELQAEINEAYEVLSHPDKRKEYLEQFRYYSKHGNFRKSKMEKVFSKCLELKDQSLVSLLAKKADSSLSKFLNIFIF